MCRSSGPEGIRGVGGGREERNGESEGIYGLGNWFNEAMPDEDRAEGQSILSTESASRKVHQNPWIQ